MRKSSESSLKEAIDQLLDHYKLRDRLNEVRLKAAWEKQMGDAICNRTSGLKLKNDILIVNISSAPLRTELTFQKKQLIEMMNKELEGDFIHDIIFR